MAGLQPPAIVVPGITATSLEDTYPLSPEEIWTPILTRNYERISMHPDDPRYDALEPARVLPRSIFGIVYNDLVEALRHDLSPRADRPTPVYAFPYDWRQDCRRSIERLGEFVQEVLQRTRLLPHYADDPPKQVDLVGHSMGGLLIAGYLTRPESRGRVRRVVTMGTPFRGAVDAVSKLSTGMGTLTGDAPRDRERESARTIPAIYQLLPSFAGIPNLFSRSEWQPSVARTLKEYCRLRQAKIDGDALFGRHLEQLAEERVAVDLRLAQAAVFLQGPGHAGLPLRPGEEVRDAREAGEQLVDRGDRAGGFALAVAGRVAGQRAHAGGQLGDGVHRAAEPGAHRYDAAHPVPAFRLGEIAGEEEAAHGMPHEVHLLRRLVRIGRQQPRPLEHFLDEFAQALDRAA